MSKTKIDATIDKAIQDAAFNAGSVDFSELAAKIGHVDASLIADIIQLRYVDTGKLAVERDLVGATALEFGRLRLAATVIQQYKIDSKVYEPVSTDDLGDGTSTRDLMTIGHELITVKFTHHVEGDGLWSVAIHEHLQIEDAAYLPVLVGQESSLTTKKEAEAFVRSWAETRRTQQTLGNLTATVTPGYESECDVLRVIDFNNPEDAPPIYEMSHADSTECWEAWSDMKLTLLSSLYVLRPLDGERVWVMSIGQEEVSATYTKEEDGWTLVLHETPELGESGQKYEPYELHREGGFECISDAVSATDAWRQARMNKQEFGGMTAEVYQDVFEEDLFRLEVKDSLARVDIKDERTFTTGEAAWEAWSGMKVARGLYTEYQSEVEPAPEGTDVDSQAQDGCTDASDEADSE